MSLCQNLDTNADGEYVIDDSKLPSQNSKYELDNDDINRINQYSPDLLNLTKNEFRD
jgi:hypothetical protein